MKALSILYSLILIAVVTQYSYSQTSTNKYQCLPCGEECDNPEYAKPGTCSHCQMPLVLKSTVKFKNIPADQICTYIAKHPTALLLDVRTKEEFDGKADPNFGTLKNAINIPIQELEGRLNELAAYKNKDIVVFCSHSHRSPRASYLLTQNGFSKVSNMSGGMSVLMNNTCKR